MFYQCRCCNPSCWGTSFYEPFLAQPPLSHITKWKALNLFLPQLYLNSRVNLSQHFFILFFSFRSFHSDRCHTLGELCVGGSVLWFDEWTKQKMISPQALGLSLPWGSHSLFYIVPDGFTSTQPLIKPLSLSLHYLFFDPLNFLFRLRCPGSAFGRITCVQKD